MATEIEKKFKGINNELERKYGVKLEYDKRITKLFGFRRKKILIPLIAVNRAKAKLEKVEETRQEMISNVEQIKDLASNTLRSEEQIDDLVNKVEKEKEKIAGLSSQALNYLGLIDSSSKVKIGSASLIIGPWQHWRGFKIRHGGWFKKLLLPLPILKSVVSRVQNKSMVSDNIADIIKYDENGDNLVISNDVIESLSPKNIAQTAIHGNDPSIEDTYEPIVATTNNTVRVEEPTIDISPSGLNKEDIDDETTIDYAENANKPNSPVDDFLINDASDDIMSNLINAAKPGTQSATSEPVVENDTKEDVIPVEPVVEPPIIEAKETEEIAKQDIKLSSNNNNKDIEKLEENLKVLTSQIAELSNKVSEILSQNEQLKVQLQQEKQKNSEIEEKLQNITEGKKEVDDYEGKHFAPIDSSRSIVRPVPILGSDLEVGTPIYHKDGQEPSTSVEPRLITR